MKHITFYLAAFVLTACAVETTPSSSYNLASPSVHDAIAAQDARIFEAAFLTCDRETLGEIMDDKLEFYHDLYGRIATTREEFLGGTIPDCEKRAAGDLPFLIRKVTADTMEVREIKGFGAMQTGQHGFYTRDESGEDILLETGEYIHLWEKRPEGWTIIRVISYDHESME